MGSGQGSVWVCLVCGYVHRGPEPPEACPVCGSARTDFEASQEPVAAPASKPAGWRCLICNYRHAGDGPPEACPVCAASADQFEPAAEAASVVGRAGGPHKVVVIGGGVAGLTAAEAVRGASPESEIVLIAKEPHLPYYRLNLTRYLAGEVSAEALPIHPESWYRDQRIRLMTGMEAAEIVPEKRTVLLGNGEIESYDRLIITCGSHPFVPPIPGAARDGVTAFRTVDDANRLIEAARPGMRYVCIGGGILGLEAAGALARRGVQVTLIETFDWLLPRQLDRAAGGVLHRYVAAHGIDVRYQVKVAEIAGDAQASGVVLADGTVLPADRVVIAAGVRANSYLARKAGLEVNQGIVVNSHLATSVPGVFAAGDVAEHRGTLYGLWEPARYQGSIAGMNAAGLDAEFGGLPRANTLKVLGIDLFSVGTITPQDGSYYVVSAEAGQGYHSFLFRDNYLVGAILIGDAHLSALAMKAVKDRRDFSALLAKAPSAADVAAVLQSS